jgi:hypothetical protein
MSMIQFVSNYQDLSTDKGFQFKFNCDKCGNGYMSSFQTSTIGMAGSLLRAAGDLFGGWASSAGNSAYEVQRAVGGSAHDSALKTAQAKAEAMRQQLYQKAQETDYVSGVDMSAGAVSASPQFVKPSEEQKLPNLCVCGFDVGSAKFCPECGIPTKVAKPKCSGCGHEVEVTTKFCPECGTNMR